MGALLGTAHGRRRVAFAALVALLPCAGVLIAHGLAHALAMLPSAPVVLLLAAVLQDDVYAQLAFQQLTDVAFDYGQIALTPWGWGPALRGAVLAEAIVAWGTALVLFALGRHVATYGLHSCCLRRVQWATVVGYQVGAVGTLLHYRLTAATVERMGLAALSTKLGGNDVGVHLTVALALEVLFLVGACVLVAAPAIAAWRRRRSAASLRSLGTVAVASVLLLLAASGQPGGPPGVEAYLRADGTALPDATPVEETVPGAAHPVAASLGSATTSRSPQRMPARARPALPGPAAVVYAAGELREEPLPVAGAGERTLVPIATQDFHQPPSVELRREGERYTLLKDDRPFVIKGMGYANVLPGYRPADRPAKWREDVRHIAARGFNTLVGWVDRQHTLPWTRELLDLAHAEGLSVILPLHLPVDADYADVATRQRLEAEVADWVRAFRDHPALLMWGPGNETLHGIGGDVPRAHAFASFYWDLADTIHALDPDHPVTYRDAEVRYLQPLRQAYLRSARERPWFVLGINAYIAGPDPRHLTNVLYEQWPAWRWDIPAYVSEFNATGVDPTTRPRAVARMWRTIRQDPQAFVGGALYVWSTAGPEVVDRTLGLVDGQNQPVDRTLAALQKELARSP